MTSISVALGTYNGARHIQAQLESLAAQTHLPLEVVVGDDGSSDGTLDRVSEFARSAPFPVRIHRNETNLGYARNFLETAKRCNGDWIAFCDQDDVWLPHKLADAAKAIEQNASCVLVLQEAWLCDGHLTKSGHKHPDRIKPGMKDRHSQYGFWVWPGFLQTVSKDVIDLWDGGALPKNYFPERPEIGHDKWTCQIANALGGICVLDEPAALYRRHDGALTGSYARRSRAELARAALQVRAPSAAAHYAFLGDVAQSCSSYMEHLRARASDPEWTGAFEHGAAAFRTLEMTHQLRAELYGSRRFGTQLSTYWKMLRAGAYVGPSFHALGLLAAAHDLLRILAWRR
ncbi:MAG: glycosyltransferase [Pseudomonadota bacterium]